MHDFAEKTGLFSYLFGFYPYPLKFIVTVEPFIDKINSPNSKLRYKAYFYPHIYS